MTLKLQRTSWRKLQDHLWNCTLLFLGSLATLGRFASSLSLSVSLCLCLSLSVSVCLCLSLSQTNEISRWRFPKRISSLRSLSLSPSPYLPLSRHVCLFNSVNERNFAMVFPKERCFFEMSGIHRQDRSPSIAWDEHAQRLWRSLCGKVW